VIIAISLLIAVIIILSIVPLAIGGLDIQIPEDEEGTWNVEGDILTLTTPVKIYNGGFYNIEDFTISYKFVNENGDTVIQGQSEPVDIIAGRTTTLDVSFVIDLNSVDPSELKRIIFESGSYDFVVNIETFYMMKLLKLGIGINNTMEWEPMVSDFGIDVDEVHYEVTDSNLTVNLPYYVYAADMLTGKQMKINCTISNATSAIGSVEKIVTLTQPLNDVLEIVIDNDAAEWLRNHSELLSIAFTLEFKGASATETYEYLWVPTT
jgi:hypothetical protein